MTRRREPSPDEPDRPLVIGFTGTRTGMTPAQAEQVESLLDRLAAALPTRHLSALHGDCVGADADFDAICKRRGIAVKIRPSSIAAMRAGCASEAIAEPKPPLVRNREIVADSDLLIACPRTRDELLRSGVWATIRAMRRLARPIYRIAPDGAVDPEGVTASPSAPSSR